jgi:plastocyanin
MRPMHVAAAALLSLALGAAAAAEMKRISQKGKVFFPDAVQMTTADTLRIVNDDAFMHHVYVKHPNLTFDSGGRRPGEPVDIQFGKPGSYEVLCEIHPKMRLLVEVK